MWPDVSMVSTAILHLGDRRSEWIRWENIDRYGLWMEPTKCQVSQIENIYHYYNYTLLTLTLKDDNIHCSAQNS